MKYLILVGKYGTPHGIPRADTPESRRLMLRTAKEAAEDFPLESPFRVLAANAVAEVIQ